MSDFIANLVVHRYKLSSTKGIKQYGRNVEEKDLRDFAKNY